MASITAEGDCGSKALTVGTHGTEDIMLYCSCLLIPAGRHRLVLALSLPILKSNSMVNRLLCSLLHSHKICHYALDLRNLVFEDFGCLLSQDIIIHIWQHIPENDLQNN